MRTPTRRFEYSEGTSNKFWEVYCIGASMFCRWGRIGSKGQSKEWGYGSTAAARSMASRKANQKIAKGYVEKLAPGELKAALEGLVDASNSASKSIAKVGKVMKKIGKKKKPKPRVPREVTFKRRGPRIG